MKKFKMMFASCLLLIVGSFLIQKLDDTQKQNGDVTAPQNEPEIVKPVQAAETLQNEVKPKLKQTGYKIQEYNGNIAVFEKGQEKPFRKTEIAVKNLPEADKTELKNGIEVSTNEELQTLLEDYLS